MPAQTLRPLPCSPARFTLAFLALVLLAACRPTPTPTIASGLTGQVFIGPMCPVVQAGTPCPDQPYQATLIIEDARRQPVAEVTTDAVGRFQVSLPPGDYVIVPQSPDGFIMAAEQPVTVLANAFTPVTLTYDSGIR
jgi:hypothetical protein